MVEFVISVLVFGVLFKFLTDAFASMTATWQSCFIAAGVGAVASTVIALVLLRLLIGLGLGLAIVITLIASILVLAFVIKSIIRGEDGSEPSFGTGVAVAAVSRIIVFVIGLIFG
ncbi:hypothetical protein [Tabrizicola sp.]|uniref:hypothetical protein n=1 Tax=Tabrizicola sp. TaxID=2005166 RepID=UPI003F2C929D